MDLSPGQQIPLIQQTDRQIQEQIWMGQWFEAMTSYQKRQIELLTSISNWVSYFGVLSVISLVLSVILLIFGGFGAITSILFR